MFKLGVTGGIGAGKSTASDFFRLKGATIFDADKEIKLFLLSNLDLQNKIIDNFGNNVTKKKSLDLNKLAEFAFSDKKYQQILNQIMWPNVHTLIESATEKATKNNIDLFVVDAALLFEAEYTDFFDSILLITAPISLRIKRILNRDDISIQQIKSRMDLQMLDPEKKELANYTIENNRDLDQFYNNLENYYRSIILK